jgi:hypothetical protein
MQQQQQQQQQRHIVHGWLTSMPLPLLRLHA